MKIAGSIFIFLISSFRLFSQAVNIDFESTSPGTYTASNSVNGWTLSSQTASCNSTASWIPGSQEFSIVATPIINFPTIGSIGNSPIGGNNVARLNNSTANSSRTKLSQTFLVNISNTLLQFAYAGLWEGTSVESCCDGSGFTIQIRDASGAITPCNTTSFSPGTGCQTSGVGFTTTTSGGIITSWTNWQSKYIDLTPYFNTNVTIEVIATDCALGGHFGTLFFDMALGGQLIGSGLTQLTTYPFINNVSFCSGSNVAQIQAPLGYTSYQWIAPGSGSVAAPQGTMSNLTINNPVANSVYTVILNTPTGCIYTATYVLSSSTVSIGAIGSNSTCAGGSSGSATVAAYGSGSGYTYSWLNSTNSVVSTASVVSGLSPGIYSIQVTAAGSSSSTCGTSTSTLAIGVSPASVISLIKPFCGTEAYICAPNGYNYQWYLNSTAISGSLGITSCYTLSGPANGGTIGVSYNNSYGCRDSLKYTLASTSPGILSVTNNPLVCQGANNGVVVLSMSPTAGTLPGQNSFSVFASGTLTPAYSASLGPGTATNFTATNLSAGGTYSVTAFDGSCKYSLNFSVNTYVFNYTLSPGNSPTLCQGNSLAAGATFSAPVSLTQYSYSWSPTTFLAGGMGNYQNTIITSSVSPGSSLTIVYTLVVTPTLINCPLSKTLAVSFANLLPPSISAIPNLCSNGSGYSITVTPTGGNFISSVPGIINTSGIITPSLASLGLNTFTYASSIGTCVAKSTGTYTVNAPPLISISGNTSICNGQSTSLLASGPANFTWTSFAPGPVITVSPNNTNTYTVTGFNTSTGCSNMKSITVMVLPLPILQIIGDTLICAGESSTLSASGANSYSWSTGSLNQNIVVFPNTSSTYGLIGTSSPGSCTSSKIVLVSVSPCTGIENIAAGALDAKIFPNPFSNKFTIQHSANLDILVSDGIGRVLIEKKLNEGNNTIDLNEFPKGIYFLKILYNNDSKTIKLIKTD